MLLIRCTEPLSGVGRGYTCVVAVRSLRHVRTPQQMNSLASVGVTPRNVNSVAFWEILNGLGVPRSAVTEDADWTRR